MDDDNCMVDVARYFIEFTRSESCGKCTPCRVGLDKALRTLTRITKGEGREEDLAELDELGRMIRDTSLCGLGQSAPNSILTALRHFRHEFEDHIREKRCHAGVCQDLAVAPCENSCPLHMNIPRFLQLYKEDRLADAFESVIMDNPFPASTGRVCQHPCESRCRRQAVDEPINMREVHRVIADSVLLSDQFDAMAGQGRRQTAPPDRQDGRRGRRRPDRPDRRVLPGADRARGHRVRIPRGARRHAALRPAGISAAPRGARPRDRDHPPPRRQVRLQLQHRHRYSAGRPGSEVRCGVPLDRHLEGMRRSGSPATNWPASTARCISSRRRPAIIRRTSARTSSSSAAAMPPSTAPARRSARARPPPSSTAANARTCRRSPRRSMPPKKKGVRFIFLASPHRIVGDGRRRQSHRGDEDPPRRLRHVRPPPPGRYRRSAVGALQQRHPGGRRRRGRRISAGRPAWRSRTAACSRSTVTP